MITTCGDCGCATARCECVAIIIDIAAQDVKDEQGALLREAAARIAESLECQMRTKILEITMSSGDMLVMAAIHRYPEQLVALQKLCRDLANNAAQGCAGLLFGE